MRLIRHLYNESSPLMILACAFAIISASCGPLMVKLISEGISGVAVPKDFVMRFLGLAGFLLLTRLGSQRVMLLLTQNAARRMRIRLSQKVVDAPYERLVELGRPKLVGILTRDVNELSRSLEMVPGMLTNIVVIIACFSYMAWLSWPLAATMVGILAVVLPVFHKLQRYPIRQLEIMRTKMDGLYKHFRGLIEGCRELQLNERRGTEFVQKIITEDVNDFRRTSIKALSSFSLVTNTGDMMFYVVIGLMLSIAPLWLPITPKSMSVTTLLLLYMVGPISACINIAPAVANANIALGRIEQLDADLVYARPPEDEAQAFRPTGAPLLELRALTHRYISAKDDEPGFQLGPIDLAIHAGEIVFIAGGNGSGKTTMAMVLLGLFKVESGELCMHGHPVGPSNIRAYRQHFSAIFYDFHLFEYLLGYPGDVREAAEHHLDRFGLSKKVKVADNKFSTIELSSGQRRRLALVMAYLEDKPIYLFDEWAADQDPAFRRTFYTELLPQLQMRGKTVIVISHDDSYYHCADRVLNLREGRLHELDLSNVQKDAAVVEAA